MPTRTFVLEGDSKRFWDISWDGASVEVTSGKWGTQGRAREANFASATARDAFIAAEIKKVEKKGYREISEIAPAPDVAPSNAGKVAAIRALVEARRRPAWLPRFEPGSEGVGVVRGPMTLDRDEAWPTCGYCGKNMVAEAETRRKLARKLAGIREKKALSQTVVAARMGTSASVVSKLEAGGDVKLSTLQRYCTAIGEKFAVAV